jgi:putative peptide zinc metalloprotease protein
MLEVSALLYEVAANLGGTRPLPEVASRVSLSIGRTVSGEDVEYLVRHKLVPLGLVADPATPAATDTASPPPPPQPAPPVLGLAWRAGVVPRRVVNIVARRLRPAFRPPVLVAGLVAAAVVDAGLLRAHAVGPAGRAVLQQPGAIALVVTLTLASGLFHELGHATASRYGGAEPGAIGIGIYLLWPVFYNDLSDSYRLSRAGRLRADLGGVYFNVLFSAALGLAYAATGAPALVVAVVAQHVLVLQQFLPFVRLDGYYVATDVLGVPDLFGRIKPILASLIPGRPTPASVRQLKVRVRVAVTVWVVVTVPVLVACLAAFVVRAPAFVAPSAEAMFRQAEALNDAIRGGAPAAAVVALVELLARGVPFVGVGIVLARLARRVAGTGGAR